MELSELIQKYKKQFIFKNEKMTLAEAKELISKLEKEPICLDNEEMMWKLRSFISRKEYFNANKLDQENKEKQAREEIDYYHNKLKKLGAVIIQPGEKYNDQVDYSNVTYHMDGKVVFKWYGGGIKLTELAPQIKEAYEVLINESSSDL